MKRITFLLLMILFAVTATFWVTGQAYDTPDDPHPIYDPLLISPYYAPASFSCNCDKTCSEITTCEEAYFQLVECGCTQRDTDHDGIPCEGLCDGVNVAPIATADSYSTAFETKLTVSVSDGILKNDKDYNGNPLSAVKVTDPSHGALVLNANGSFEYTPNSSFSGSDSFTYKANDGTNESDIATVSITVEAETINPSPVATGDNYSTPFNTKLSVSASNGVLKNDTDANGDTLSAVKVSDPSHGTLVFNANGSFDYTPNSGYSGSDTFTYKTSDGSSESGIATVTITVNAEVIDLELLYPTGFISDVLGITYTWRHTGSSGYMVYLAPQNDLGAPRFYQWISAGQYCDDSECNVQLTEISLSAWLENNAYEVWLCGTSSGFTCPDVNNWKGPFRFTLNASRPGLVNFLTKEEIPDLTATGSPEDDPPTFVWQLDGSAANASWFQVWYGYVVPQQNAPTIYWPITFGWYPRTDLCEGDICALKTTTQKLCFDGHYEVYVQSWGPGGLSTGGIEGWADFQNETCDPGS